jgi:hypothetical protein
VWSANVNCHKFKVPLECCDTIEMAGEGSADTTSDRLPPLPESSTVELAEPATYQPDISYLQSYGRWYESKSKASFFSSYNF